MILRHYNGAGAITFYHLYTGAALGIAIAMGILWYRNYLYILIKTVKGV